MVDALPIDADLARIRGAVAERGAVVVVAPPGAGKTTRVPAELLGPDRRVVCTQPRRLAARLAARRVASELGGPVGDLVGYEVRFERAVGPRTRLRFVTEGVALRQIVGGSDHLDVLILDELHERHLAADAILALARRARAERPDLRLVAMSATLDAERVAAYLDAPVIETRGRLHPVAVEHLAHPSERRLEDEVAAAFRRLLADGLDGDVLVFLPGVGEIRRAQERCAELAARADVDVVALHGNLPAAEQDRAVAPATRRRLILSTNVAETSLTIEGVVAVIDSGLARVARHAPWSGIASLRVEPIAQASAAQRAGRAGRVRPGRCLRLYTQHDHDTRRAHDPPEIVRADLSDLALQLGAAGVGLGELAWLDAPPAPAVGAADALLRDLGAIDATGRITARGQRMRRSAAHPRQARVALAAAELGAARSGCAVAALLGERPIALERRTGEPARHQSDSDLLDDLDAFERAEAAGFRRDRMRRDRLDAGAVRAVARARDQLVRQTGAGDDALADGPDRDQALAQAVLAGYPDRVARRRSAGSAELLLAGGGAATASRSSAVLGAELVVVTDAELRERGVLVRSATAIDPSWLLEHEGIEEIDEVHFDRTRERVERLSGLRYRGIVIEEERTADRGRIDPERAAEVLAEAAIAAGVERFVDASELASLRARVELVRSLGHGALRSLDDATLRDALRQAAGGCASFAELRAAHVLALVAGALGGDAHRLLERLAPTHVAIPGRRRVRVHYEPDRPPWIESRLQDFFGAEAGPAVGGGAVPVVLHLLAPNRRAVQVTSDLAGFWQRHYPALRRELSRRYPKHAWPEDPLGSGQRGR